MRLLFCFTIFTFLISSCKKDNVIDCNGKMTVQTNFSWAPHDSWSLKIYKDNMLVHEKYLNIHDGKQDTVQLPAARYKYSLIGYIGTIDDAYISFDSTSNACDKVVLTYN